MAKKAKPKKRGVKPGTKRGKYKKVKPITLPEYTITAVAGNTFKVGDKIAFDKASTPAPIITLCGQLEDAITLLENRISNSIAKINSLM